MPDASSTPADEPTDPDADADPESASESAFSGAPATADEEMEALRREVEEKYDFDDFGPEQMAQMNMAEWEAAFDPDSWIVGDPLLERVEKELKGAIARRDVFAKVEPFSEDGGRRLVAYSDEGYAIVYPDGSVEGEGTVMRDVKPIVALCSMDSYEVAEPPAEFDLPDPTEVPEGSGEFGNLMLQIVAFTQLLMGLGLLAVWLYDVAVAGAVGGLEPILATGGPVNLVLPVLGGIMLLIGLFLFLIVANARLSDRFRAEEYRNRLRAVGVEDGERPAFLPPFDDADDGEGVDATAGGDGDGTAPAADPGIDADAGREQGATGDVDRTRLDGETTDD